MPDFPPYSGSDAECHYCGSRDIASDYQAAKPPTSSIDATFQECTVRTCGCCLRKWYEAVPATQKESRMPDDKPTTPTGMLNAWLQEHDIGDGLPDRAVPFADLLYPRYAYRFQSIPLETWLEIQRRAAASLAQVAGGREIRKHWRDIIDGKVPFGLHVVNRAGEHCDTGPLA